MADSPSAVIAQCDVTYAMLSDPDAAKAVATQADGVVAGIKKSPGKAYVDVSTVDEGTSQEIAKAVADAGGRYLEACSLDILPLVLHDSSVMAPQPCSAARCPARSTLRMTRQLDPVAQSVA